MLPWEREPVELPVTFKILVIQVLNCPGMHGLHYLEKGAAVRQASCSKYHHVCWAYLAFSLRPSPGLGAHNIPTMEDQGRWLTGIFSRLKEGGSWWCCRCFQPTCNKQDNSESELILTITLLKGLRKVLPRQELWPLGIYIKTGHLLL